jgi:molybdopterin/thiamine biosynthesis adenylyltransferase
MLYLIARWLLKRREVGMHSRNWLFISDTVQKALGKVTVLCAGVGLGSVVAELAVRTGIRRFVLADGDRVETSNLNRQAYTSRDVGRNKAEAAADRLRQIRPDVEITVVPQFLARADLESWIPRCDVVVNTIDFDSEAFSACSEIARRAGKLELFPTNLGFGGSVICFEPQAPSLSACFGNVTGDVLKGAILDHLVARNPDVAPYLLDALGRYRQEARAYDPQLGVSSYVTAAMAVTAIVRKFSGETLRVFPEFYYADVNLP